MRKPILVTEPYLPPLDEYIERLRGIWENHHVTNQGPMVAELESSIRHAQSLDGSIVCVANGALGLQILLKAMGIRGEVVTTPYTYIATSSCPSWEGCNIRFADIEEFGMTIDPEAVEAAITPSTEAIIATHLYGNPCDCVALASIAEKHGIALIYDAAHAYQVRHNEQSVLSYGDASMVSMHATKIFHSAEGGFLVSKHQSVMEKAEWMRRFGHNGNSSYHGVGINAKMSELHAAMGLCVLAHMDEIIRCRRLVCEGYDDALNSIDGVRFAMTIRDGTDWNAAYYPVRFDSEEQLLKAVERMELKGVFPRRYFHPVLNQSGLANLGMESCPVAEKISKEVLCLPLSAQMSAACQGEVIDALESSLA